MFLKPKVLYTLIFCFTFICKLLNYSVGVNNYMNVILYSGIFICNLEPVLLLHDICTYFMAHINKFCGCYSWIINFCIVYESLVKKIY